MDYKVTIKELNLPTTYSLLDKQHWLHNFSVIIQNNLPFHTNSICKKNARGGHLFSSPYTYKGTVPRIEELTTEGTSTKSPLQEL